MYRNYAILFNLRIPVFIGLLLCLIVSAWIALPDKFQEYISEKCLKKKYKGNELIEQIVLLFTILIINAFTCISLGDYFQEHATISFIVCIVQIFGIIRLFVHVKKPDDNIKRALILGLLSLILDFTNIYVHLYLFYRKSGPFDIQEVVEPFDVFIEFLFYSISLVLPYPLTEIMPKNLIAKIISLGQIVLFTVLVLKKLSEIIGHNKKVSEQ